MWTGILFLLIAIILLAGAELGGKYLLVWLAQQDKWWSNLRILPTSGQFYYIALSDSMGRTERIVHSVPGWDLIDLPDGTCKFIELNAANPATRSLVVPPPPGWLAQRGLIHVGFFRSFYKRTRRYDALEPKKGGEKGWDIVQKERKDHLFFFHTEMVAVIAQGTNTIDNFPVNLTIPFTARIINPIRAEFFAGKWEVQITNAVRAAARDYVEAKKYQDLLDERDSGNANLLAAILDANASLAAFGVEIITPRIEKFDLASATADYADATRAVEIARLNADAKKEEARGIRTLGDARADAIKAAGAAFKDSGVPDLAIADAIREAKPSVVSIGSGGTGVVVPLPEKK